MTDSEKKNTDSAEPENASCENRPNAKYSLSRQARDGEEPVFYYNRERRLAKASQQVRDLYKEEKPRRFGLFRSLIDSKPRAMLFGSILIICAAIFVLSVLGYTSDTYELDGNQLSVQAIRLEGSILVAVKKKTGKTGFAFQGIPYSGAVNVAVSPAGGANAGEDQPAVFLHRLFFTLEETENFHFTVPFDCAELALFFQTEKKTLNFTIKPE